jgi:hypothetical protein
MMGKIDIEDAVLCGVWANSDIMPMEGVGELEFAPTKAEFTIPLHSHDLVIRAIFDRRQDLGEGPRARAIAGDGRLHLQRLMGALVVIDLAPAVESRLGMGQILEAPAVKHFSLERAVETFFLAIGLRVIGTAMAEADPQADQPQPEFSYLPGLARRSPRRPVVEIHANRQTIAAESGFQMLADGRRAGVAASLQHQVVARMVVEHGQRRATAFQGLEMSLEVCLPQGVGKFVLEALPSLVLLSRRRESARADAGCC